MHSAANKTVRIEATRSSYATGATNTNAKNAAVGLDSVIPEVVTAITTDANGGAGFTSVSKLGYAQDAANIISALDWRLTAAQAAQVFDELSSAEIHSSLAALDQNGVFGQSLDILTERRSAGASQAAALLGGEGGVGARLWFNPVGVFGKYGANPLGASGQSAIKANTYGGSLGLDIAYSDTGAFGFGLGYAEHDVNARTTPESADGKTVSFGAYVTQGFGPLYANLKLAYGFSKFKTSRSLALLARTPTAEYKGNQFDAALQVGYDLVTGSATITPYAELALRNWKLNGFTETGGGGIGVTSGDRSKSVFNPQIGVKFTANVGDPEGFALRPFGRLAYTFQGDIGQSRQYSYLAGGSPFTLDGVNPKGFGTAELGLDMSLGERVGMWLSGSYDFGGRNSVGALRAGMDFSFGGGHREVAPPPPPPAARRPRPRPRRRRLSQRATRVPTSCSSIGISRTSRLRQQPSLTVLSVPTATAHGFR